jgi:rubredoxin
MSEAPAWTCPQCGHQFEMTPYDIGSGPEVSCSLCEWCWGAEGQPLKPLTHPAVDMATYFDLPEEGG